MRALALPAAYLALAFAGSAYAQAEEELAERYAPVVRLVEQEEECGPGEPYEPIDIDAILDEDTVSLRGPWRSNDLVEIAPSADDLAGPLRVQPRLSRRRPEPRLRLRALGPARHRGHRADDVRPRGAGAGAPRPPLAPVLALLPLQRLEQPARGRLGDDPARLPGRERRGGPGHGAARDRLQPARGRRAGGVGEEKLELVDGTHPVVYPAAGSHANFFTEGLHLGRSAEQGSAATTRPARMRDPPQALSIPSDPEAARTRSLDRVRGSLGRAPAGVLQRPHGAEPERSGRSPSPGRRTGATELRRRRAAPSGPKQPTSSATRSRQGRTSSSGPWTTAGGSPSSSASSPPR